MQVSINNLPFEVEVEGNPAGPPMLLIMGLGMQLTSWPPEFVAELVGRGFRVIRFDNRDAGLSAKWDHWGMPNLLAASLQHLVGVPVRAPYRIEDMAGDALGVLDALGVQRVHLVGASMGGMMAQALAIRNPERIASFTCIMSSSGARHLPGPAWKVRQALLSRPADAGDTESVVNHYVKLFTLIGSPDFPTPEPLLRERFGRNVRRAYHPEGTARQLVAVAASADRSAQLRHLRVPTQIIHGREDPLVPVAAAFDLADKIPDAQLEIIAGMGHDLPPALVPRITERIAQHATARL
jgi:pimeloyl-ACP methyl ester carboxylesterase